MHNIKQNGSSASIWRHYNGVISRELCGNGKGYFKDIKKRKIKPPERKQDDDLRFC